MRMLGLAAVVAVLGSSGCVATVFRTDEITAARVAWGADVGLEASIESGDRKMRIGQQQRTSAEGVELARKVLDLVAPQ